MNDHLAGRLTITAATLCLTAAALGACGTRQPGDEPSPSAPASSSASPSDSPSPSTTTSPSPEPPTQAVLDVRRLPTGAEPGLAWAELAFEGTRQVGGTLHALDGDTVALPAYSLNEFAPLGDGWVVDMVDPDNGEELVFLLTAAGDHGDPWPAQGGIAVSPGGNVVAWTAPDGVVRTAHGRTGDVLTMPSVPTGRGAFRTVGVTSEDCKEGRTSDGGCTVVVNGSGGAVHVTTSHGIVDRLPKLLAATTSRGRLVGGMTSVDEDPAGSCSDLGVLFGKVRWSTCDHTLDAISPDREHLLGLPAYLDGFGPTTLAVLSAADGSPVYSWTGNRRSATYFDQVWEDDSHVLVRTFQRDRWAIVRLGVDGSMEYAVAPVRADSLASPFMLQTR